MIFSLLGVAGLGLTLWFNLEAWRQARDSESDTKVALREAIHANVISRENQVIQFRPWITSIGAVVSISAEANLDGRKVRNALFLIMRWKNTGNTPAIKVGIASGFDVIPMDADLPKFESVMSGHDATISSQDIFSADTFGLDEAATERFINREIEVILYSRVEYRDALYPDKERVSETTLRCRFNGWVYHNGERRVNADIHPSGPQNQIK